MHQRGQLQPAFGAPKLVWHMGGVRCLACWTNGCKHRCYSCDAERLLLARSTLRGIIRWYATTTCCCCGCCTAVCSGPSPVAPADAPAPGRVGAPPGSRQLWDTLRRSCLPPRSRFSNAVPAGAGSAHMRAPAVPERPSTRRLEPARVLVPLRVRRPLVEARGCVGTSLRR